MYSFPHFVKAVIIASIEFFGSAGCNTDHLEVHIFTRFFEEIRCSSFKCRVQTLIKLLEGGTLCRLLLSNVKIK